jgi:hypothetical protein
LTSWLLVLAVLGPATAEAAAPVVPQRPWEYAPYRIQVWIALVPSPELTARLRERIAETIAQRADVVAGATWDLRTVRCPPAVAAVTAQQIAAVTVEDVQAADPQLLKSEDKLFLLRVRAEPDGWSLAARELDCPTRLWRPTETARIVQPEQIPDTAAALVATAFSPLARIESVKDSEAKLRVRAGGLVTEPTSPAAVHDSAVLLPVLRIDDRQGEPLKNGIQVVPWTLLSVKEREGSALKCRVFSGGATTLGGRTSSRVIKLALVVKPHGAATQLRVTTGGATPVALPGYEIRIKDPDTSASDLVGITDWRGMVTVPRAGKTLRVLQVRSGSRLVAVCPVVPGLDPELLIRVPNDELRLEAEGFVQGLQTRVMDIMARRELYKARFQRHLEKKEFDRAQGMLDEFRRLETRAELSRLLDVQEQRLTTPDRATQKRIDKLFADTRQVLLKFLDPTTADQLAAQLAKATGKGS